MGIDEMKRELFQYQTFMEEVYPFEINMMARRLTIINSYMARTSYLWVEAKKMRDEAIKEIFTKQCEMLSTLSPSVANKIVDAFASEFNYLVNWSERINRKLTHQSDNLRTQISFEKQQLNLTRNGY